QPRTLPHRVIHLLRYLVQPPLLPRKALLGWERDRQARVPRGNDGCPRVRYRAMDWTQVGVQMNWREVEGWFDDANYEAFKRLELPKNPLIFECGTYKGRSTWAFTELWPT